MSELLIGAWIDLVRRVGGDGDSPGEVTKIASECSSRAGMALKTVWEDRTWVIVKKERTCYHAAGGWRDVFAAVRVGRCQNG